MSAEGLGDGLAARLFEEAMQGLPGFGEQYVVGVDIQERRRVMMLWLKKWGHDHQHGLRVLRERARKALSSLDEAGFIDAHSMLASAENSVTARDLIEESEILGRVFRHPSLDEPTLEASLQAFTDFVNSLDLPAPADEV